MIDAKEARRKTVNRKGEIEASKLAQEKRLAELRASTEEEILARQMKQELKTWDYFIESACDHGEDSVKLSYPDSEALFLMLQKHYEAKGFRVSEWAEDAGYCIGDRWWVTIYWS